VWKGVAYFFRGRNTTATSQPIRSMIRSNVSTLGDDWPDSMRDSVPVEIPAAFASE
jgi:hypothetical protein